MGSPIVRLRSAVTTRPHVAIGGLVGLVVAAALTRGGLAAHPDTPYYWSAAQQWRDGAPGFTDLVPPFTRYRLADIARRAAHMPFVDFPIGYPFVWGVLGLALGLRAGGLAISLVCAAAIAAAAASLVGRPSGSRTAVALPIVVGAGLVLTPEIAVSLQAYQSEPLLLAIIAVALGVAIARIRDGRSTTGLWCVAAAAGVVRFVGAPLLLVPMYVEWLRGTRGRPMLARFGIALLPAAANLVWASAQGTGRLHLHSISGGDLTEARMTLAGWWWGPAGSAQRAFTDRPGLLHTLALLATVAVVAIAFVRAVRRRDDEIIVLLGAGLVLLVGLVGGMVLFDGFVSFNPRMLVPTQLCFVLAAARGLGRRQGTNRADGRRTTTMLWAGVALWLGVAVAPWTSLSREWPSVRWTVSPTVAGLIEESSPSFVVSNVATDISMAMSIPSTFLPPSTNIVTGEHIDQRRELEGLSCILLERGGVVITDLTGVFGQVDAPVQAWLDDETSAGRLRVAVQEAAARYTPTDTACD